MDIKKETSKILFLMALIICMTYIMTAILGERYLYSDGANYFLSVASSGKFSIYPLGRATCDKLMQVFAVLGGLCGCGSLKLEGVLFAFGCTFWPSIWFLSSLKTCRKHLRRDLEYLTFIIYSMVLLFYGFYCQLEPVIGFSNYLSLLLLCLLHDENKTFWGKFEIILMIIGSLLCYHLNEYYCMWSLVLAAVVVYRILFPQGKKLRKVWLLVAIWHLYCAYTSYLSIPARGEVPNLLDELTAVFQQKYFILFLILLIFILIISLNNFKVPPYVIIISECLFFIFFALCAMANRSGIIITRGYQIRFALFGGGIIIGIVLFVICFWKEKIQVGNESRLCALITVILVFYQILGGIKFYEFNTEYYEICMNESASGFLPLENNTMIGGWYYVDWIVPYQSVAVQGVRGNKNINAILTAEDTIFDQYEIKNYPDLSKYGICYGEVFYK